MIASDARLRLAYMPAAITGTAMRARGIAPIGARISYDQRRTPEPSLRDFLHARLKRIANLLAGLQLPNHLDHAGVVADAF